jgi:hypothetical protein
MKFRPLHDRVVVKRIEAEERTAGGKSSPTQPRRSRNRERSSPSDQAVAMRLASSIRSTVSLATACCSASGQEPKSRSTASSTWS